MTENNNKFQELLKVIKRYNGDGTDYLLTNMESGNHHTGEKFEKADIYQIYSPELKKEACRLMLNGDTEDGGICRFGAQSGEKWYQYEKGDGNQPDKLEIRDISSEEKEEIRSRKEQIKRSQEELEKNRKELEQRREEWEKSFENSNGEKKCAGCGKELSPKSAKAISIKPKPAGDLEQVYFCSGSDCSANFFRERDSKRENKPDKNVP